MRTRTVIAVTPARLPSSSVVEHAFETRSREAERRAHLDCARSAPRTSLGIGGGSQPASPPRDAQRVAQVEPAVVERAAGDDALDAVRWWRASCMMSAMPATPPLAITGMRSCARQRERGGDVAALEHAVAADIGEQQRGDAGIGEARGEIGDGEVGHVGPAVGRDEAVARIDRRRRCGRADRARRPSPVRDSRARRCRSRRDRRRAPASDRCRRDRGCRRRPAPCRGTPRRSPRPRRR